MSESVIRFRLAELLEERGWSAYRLAKESGIPQPTVYRLLDDSSDRDARVSLRTLDSLLNTLGVPIDQLIAHTPPKRKTK